MSRVFPHRTVGTGQGGVSLIEVLVAVFVLSIGIFGATALQLTSKRANLEALQRATATTLAQDIVERMRSNAGELVIYNANGAGLTLTGNVMPFVDCSLACTSNQIAAYDLYEWEQALAGVTVQSGGNNVGGLVSPTACVTGPVAGASGEYTVAIAWRGQTALSNPVLDPCGQGSGLYDSRDGTQADVHRRLLVINTFIAQPI